MILLLVATSTRGVSHAAPHASRAAGWQTPVLAAFNACTLAADTPPGRVFAVTEFKAVGDGASLDTEAIQRAVDACIAAGGGTVFFPPGAFLSGTVFLKVIVSNVVAQPRIGSFLGGYTARNVENVTFSNRQRTLTGDMPADAALSGSQLWGGSWNPYVLYCRKTDVI